MRIAAWRAPSRPVSTPRQQGCAWSETRHAYGATLAPTARLSLQSAPETPLRAKRYEKPFAPLEGLYGANSTRARHQARRFTNFGVSIRTASMRVARPEGAHVRQLPALPAGWTRQIRQVVPGEDRRPPSPRPRRRRMNPDAPSPTGEQTHVHLDQGPLARRLP